VFDCSACGCADEFQILISWRGQGEQEDCGLGDQMVIQLRKKSRRVKGIGEGERESEGVLEDVRRSGG
jgi:hypothetical protein